MFDSFSHACDNSTKPVYKACDVDYVLSNQLNKNVMLRLRNFPIIIKWVVFMLTCVIKYLYLNTIQAQPSK